VKLLWRGGSSHRVQMVFYVPPCPRWSDMSPTRCIRVPVSTWRSSTCKTLNRMMESRVAARIGCFRDESEVAAGPDSLPGLGLGKYRHHANVGNGDIDSFFVSRLTDLLSAADALIQVAYEYTALVQDGLVQLT
jgi:hypothetical protein